MKYIVAGLSFLSLLLAGRLFFLYEDLRECRAVPDFRPAVAHVKKFVGYERTFNFYVECTGNDIFDDCTIAEPKDVTGKSITLEVKREGSVGGSSYVVDWVEEAIFYVDLSDKKMWDINESSHLITLTVPKVEFSRVLRNKSYLPYIKDKKWLKNDEKRLIKLIKKTDEVSSQKVSEYLRVNRSKINKELETSISVFTKDIINKLGYPSDYKVEVKFEGN